MKKSNSLAAQIAELEEPAPKEFDPEVDVDVESSDADGADDSEEENDELAGTEHYVEVGKSKLLKRQEVALGPQYAGAPVSRQDLLNENDDEDIPSSDVYEDAQETLEAEEFVDPDTVEVDLDADADDDDEIDSDEAFGESDEEKFKLFTFRGSAKPKDINAAHRSKRKVATDFMSYSGEEEEEEDIEDGSNMNEDMEEEGEEGKDDDDDISDEESSDGAEDDDFDSDQEDEDEEDDESEEEEESEKQRRSEIRKIMSEEEQSVVATISQAARADVDKGNAVKQQRKIFDSLLNIRMRLQKALVATNSLLAAEEKDEDQGKLFKPYEAAEEAAINLLNNLGAIRHELQESSSQKAGQKRKRSLTLDTPNATIWERIQDSETSAVGPREATLEKWSAKIRGTTVVPVSRKLNTTVAQQNIIDVLHGQLANSERLIKRTKMPRSCAPLQVKAKVAEDPNIYDDADFYQLLLKELVDQRMMDSSAVSAPAANGGRPVAAWTAVKEAKTKRHVDTKASKGRKMRYTVHEKLQNSMAPEDRGSWEPEAVDRFFATLLGQKVDLGEDITLDGDDDGRLAPEEALMLFRS